VVSVAVLRIGAVAPWTVCTALPIVSPVVRAAVAAVSVAVWTTEAVVPWAVWMTGAVASRVARTTGALAAWTVWATLAAGSPVVGEATLGVCAATSGVEATGAVATAAAV
jgi:hypothetical protein